jgi:hypothetical protein
MHQGPLARLVYNDIQRNAVLSLLVLSLPYMAVHVMAEGAVVSRGPVPVRPKPVRSSRGKSGGGIGMSTTVVGPGDVDF